jgi:predicted transposase/invertase (TIGR01784 family)
MATKVKPYSDIFVRYLLGDEKNKDLLISFINAVNNDSNFILIKDVSIKNPVNFKNFQSDKESILDIKGIDEQGKQYDIEVQVTDYSFIQKSLYYWAKYYTSQLNAGSKYHALKPVICINILTFDLIPDFKSSHTCFMLLEKNNPEICLTEDIVLHFLELSKFEKKDGFNTNLEKWLAYFKYEGEEEAIMRTVIKEDTIFNKAHEEYSRFVQDDEMVTLYEARMKWQLDYNSGMAAAEEKGIEKGIEKGKIEDTEKMILKKIDDSDICDITGLSMDKIKEIRRKLKQK